MCTRASACIHTQLTLFTDVMLALASFDTFNARQAALALSFLLCCVFACVRLHLHVRVNIFTDVSFAFASLADTLNERTRPVDCASSPAVVRPLLQSLKDEGDEHLHGEFCTYF